MTGLAAIALGPSARLTRSRTSRLDLTRGELRLGFSDDIRPHFPVSAGPT